MKYFIIYTILFFTSFYTSIAQEIQIFSQEDKMPLPFAVIAFKANGIIVDATRTDDNGKIFLSLKAEVDSIEIYQFGYQTLSICRKDIQNQIYLQDEVIPLAEVKLVSNKKSSKKRKIEKMGYPIKYKGVSWSMALTPEIVALMENRSKKEKKVKSFSFRLYNSVGTSHIFKIIFYSNNNGIIGKPILKDSPKQVFTLTPEQIKVKLDVTDLQIVMPKEGFFVGLECIGYIDNNTNQNIFEVQNIKASICLLKSKIESAKFVYTRGKLNKRMKDWYNMGIYKKDLFSTLLQEDEYFVPAFGIEVYE